MRFPASENLLTGMMFIGSLASLAIKNLLLVLNWFPHTGMRRLVIATPLTEGLPAAPHTTAGTNSRSAVSTCRHSTIATGRPYVTVACSMFDLAVGIHRSCHLPLSFQFSKQFADAFTSPLKFLKF